METTREHFERLVADALDQIPEQLAKFIDNVAVFVEDWPTPAQLAGVRGMLLGLYQGVDLTRRSPVSYVGTMPDRITIFRGPISAMASDEQDLVRIVTRTVVHEVAHHFGISDRRLHELGWG
ncbi:MAG: metallopeptidase family protein [Acidimicrobiales bacterium]